MEHSELFSPTPLLPTYRNARQYLQIMNGIAYENYRRMVEAISQQHGNPQSQVDWADPNAWIFERLIGTEQALALKIWTESNGNLNPRYLRGCWYLANRHDLLIRNQNGLICLTDRGQLFLQENKEIVSEIDWREGLISILRTVAEKGPGKRSNFLPEYADYSRTYTTFHSDNAISDSLYHRLINLADRKLISRNGQIYEVMDAGITYLDLTNNSSENREIRRPQAELLRLSKELTQQARKQLSDYLATMNPFKFESLVKLLLEEMGYINVETTSSTNDKGVDVVADIELGITRVREVVQVKRYKSNVGREILDMLRGSLHRFHAVRGTIITTGGFAKGAERAAFESGAAPITLIDGDKLLDLLIEYGIGVTKKSVEYIEFDGSQLVQFSDQITLNSE
jgi:restriction system protein